MTLVDTSAWIEALRKDGDPSVRAEVATLLETGKAVLCGIVILELWNGARGEQERSRLQKIVETLDHVPTSEAVWEMASSLAVLCRINGVTVPATDLLVSATARVYGLSLLENDRHFGMIPPETEQESV
jgi:predicted nucleic acid-binding protein